MEPAKDGSKALSGAVPPTAAIAGKRRRRDDGGSVKEPRDKGQKPKRSSLVESERKRRVEQRTQTTDNTKEQKGRQGKKDKAHKKEKHASGDKKEKKDEKAKKDKKEKKDKKAKKDKKEKKKSKEKTGKGNAEEKLGQEADQGAASPVAADEAPAAEEPKPPPLPACDDAFAEVLDLVVQLPNGSSARHHALARIATHLGKSLLPEDMNLFVRDVQLSLLGDVPDIRPVEPEVPKVIAPSVRTLVGGDAALAGLAATLGLAPPPPPPGDTTAARVAEICTEMLARRPVLNDGIIELSNLKWFFNVILDTAETAKHWETVWLHMGVEALSDTKRSRACTIAVRTLLDLMVEPPPRVVQTANALAHLTRTFRVKLMTLEESVADIAPDLMEGDLPRRCPEALRFLPQLLANFFPQPRDAGWGWSRAGWRWQEWWGMAERLLSGAPVPVILTALHGTQTLLEARGASSEALRPLHAALKRHGVASGPMLYGAAVPQPLQVVADSPPAWPVEPICVDDL